MNYNIVPMDRSHIDQIATLERQSFSTPWSRAMLEEELFHPHASFLVAEGADGKVLGYAGLHVVLDEGYIANIAVIEDFRRRGVAGQILDVYCRFAEAHLAFLTLEVRASNEGAIALYQGHGFAEVGRRPNFYQEPREDAVLMTRYFKTEGAEV